MTKSEKQKKRVQNYVKSKSGKDDDKKSSHVLEDGVDLQQLQDKIKRQPDLYAKEFKEHYAIFKEKIAEFKENPAKKDNDVAIYFKFFSHVSINIYNIALWNYGILVLDLVAFC